MKHIKEIIKSKYRELILWRKNIKEMEKLLEGMPHLILGAESPKMTPREEEILNERFGDIMMSLFGEVGPRKDFDQVGMDSVGQHKQLRYTHTFTPKI